MNTIENTIANDNVIPLFTPSRCPHDWEPIEGWRARYHCHLCGSIGRKERLVLPPRTDGSKGRPGITSYRCHFRAGGKRCNAFAVARVDGKPRCPAHGGAKHTHAARKTLRSR